MHEIAFDLLILLTGIWVVAVTLRPLGLPTVMGELIVGVLVGPAVFGLIEPDEAIQMLAEIGIFFLMFHAGVETQPLEFYDALKRSLGVAVVGAIVPFSVSYCVAVWFGLDWVGATFVGLTMTATAVVITLKSLKDLGLSNTRVARVIVASCVIDDLLTLVFFGLIIGMLSGGSFEPLNVVAREPHPAGPRRSGRADGTQNRLTRRRIRDTPQSMNGRMAGPIAPHCPQSAIGASVIPAKCSSTSSSVGGVWPASTTCTPFWRCPTMVSGELFRYRGMATVRAGSNSCTYAPPNGGNSVIVVRTTKGTLLNRVRLP